MEIIVLTLAVFGFILAIVLALRSGADAADREHTETRSAPKAPVARHTAPTKESPQPLKTLKGKAWVVDGDTIDIQGVRLRLFGIDAPEMEHPYGRKAKYAMMALCKGEIVTASVLARDEHGRTVARCVLSDGRDLSAELVKQGLALDWAKYSGGIYREFEQDGVRKKLWRADVRQKGRIDLWEKYPTKEERAKAAKNT